MTKIIFAAGVVLAALCGTVYAGGPPESIMPVPGEPIQLIPTPSGYPMQDPHQRDVNILRYFEAQVSDHNIVNLCGLEATAIAPGSRDGDITLVGRKTCK